jgi:hypothetical protein
MSTIKNPADPAAAVATMPAPTRMGYVFPVPAEVRLFDSDPKEFTLEPLSVEKELLGSRLAAEKNNPYLQMAVALVEVDGQPMDWTRRQGELAIASWSPKVRDLFADAYKSLHAATATETRDFLSKRRIKTLS